MKTALIRYTVSLLEQVSDIEFPTGYKEIWRIEHDNDTVSLVVKGPFPVEHVDGQEIGVLLTQENNTIKWEWEIDGRVFSVDLP